MTQEAQRLLNELFRDIMQTGMRIESNAAKADPQKHKLTTVFEGKPLSYRYGGYIHSRGKKIAYCWSCHRNAAGYFIGWREVETPVKPRPTKPGAVVSTTKRDMWTARKVKKRLEELQMRRSKAHRARLANGGKKK